MTDSEKYDSLGRKRLAPERYSQAGGWKSKAKHIVWICKHCSRAWNVSSRSSRYDSKCRQCGTRNSILLTTPQTYYQARQRVTKFSEYSHPEDAQFAARKHNHHWMKRRLPKYDSGSFEKASLLNKPQGSIDEKGHHHPKTKEMS
tara:strand:- start:77 stop:511 length:435 start_codon:yes stop_codon:yes gene_type:complete